MKQLRPYQARAVEWLSKQRKGILIIPAGGGKTFVAVSALAVVVNSRTRTRKVRIGWLAPTIEIRNQALATMMADETLRQQDLRVECATIYADMSDRDVIVYDECKHAGGDCLRKIVESCPGARWGLDATPFGENEDRNETLRTLFGNNVFEVTRQEVGESLTDARVIMLPDSDPNLKDRIDELIKLKVDGQLRRSDWLRAQSLEAAVKAIHLPVIIRGGENFPTAAWRTARETKQAERLTEAVEKIVRSVIYQRVAMRVVEEIGIIGNKARNAAVIRAAMAHPEASKLILVGNIGHGTWIEEQIPGSRLFHSKMGKKLRATELERFNRGELLTMIATQLADEGLDVPRASVLVLAGAGRSKNRTVQRTGRVLRTYDGKTEGIIYDFEDKFHPMAERHAKTRRSVYRELKYRFEGELI